MLRAAGGTGCGPVRAEQRGFLVSSRLARAVVPLVVATLGVVAPLAVASAAEAPPTEAAGAATGTSVPEPSPSPTVPAPDGPSTPPSPQPEPGPTAVPQDSPAQEPGPDGGGTPQDAPEPGTTGTAAPEPGAAAAAGAAASYGGVTVPVPEGWRVVDLAADPTACVRYDIATIYLGPAGDDPSCPATVFGSAPTIQLADVGVSALPGEITLAPGSPFSVTAPQETAGEVVARVPGTAVRVLATLADDRGPVESVLSSLQVTSAPTRSRAALATVAAAAAPAPLDRSFTWGNGEGFDACTAPGLSTMNAWRSASPYRTVGVYIGGSARGCAQPNLTADYLRSLATSGWSALPIYVGRQAPCSAFASKITPGAEAQQGAEAALDAVARARALGLGAGSDIYYDMESYTTGGACSASVLAYLTSWTQTLRANGYSSGVYSSVSTGIRDLSSAVGRPGFVAPDKIWLARWSGTPSIYGHAPYVADNQWAPYSRVHQYRGGHVETWGGVSVNIDSNRVDTDPRAGSPRGRLDGVATSRQTVTASGWAFDPDQSGPIIVQVYVDGRPAAMAWATASRPDVASAYPAAGANHGFSVSASAGAGAHEVCVYAVNVGPGSSSALGCIRAVVPSSDPFGRIDALTTSSGAVTASGWTIDPDTSAPLIVQVYVDGQPGAMGWASTRRPDVGAAYPSAGAEHGYSVRAAAGPGDHTVCVYAVNQGPGSSSLLGCGRVTVPSGDPIGRIDSARVDGGAVVVSGWALDPDTTSSVIVQTYVDGAYGGMARADGPRPDVAAAYPGSGSAHGYSVRAPAVPGVHDVCVYAVNIGPGTSSSLGCVRVSG